MDDVAPINPPEIKPEENLDKKKKSRNVIRIVLVIIFLLIISGAGFYYPGSKRDIENSTSSLPNTQKNLADTSRWTTLDFSGCGTSLKYPTTWRDGVAPISNNKYACSFRYWKPKQGNEMQTDAVLIDVIPETFSAGKFEEKIEIDKNSREVKKITNGKETVIAKNITIVNINGVETAESSTEEKNPTDITLKTKSIYFKKGTYYLRIMTQYVDESSEVAQYFDSINSTVKFTQNDSYYNQFSAESNKQIQQTLQSLPKQTDQLAQANNTKRSSDVNVILNTVNQYMADKHVAIPSVITTSEREISKSQVDLCSLFVPEFISALPTDPKINDGKAVVDCNTSYSTGYTIFKDPSTNKVVVRAPNAELGVKIEVTR